MMRALIEGQADPDALAELAKGKLRVKLPALRKALQGRFENHHAFVLERMLAHVEELEATSRPSRSGSRKRSALSRGRLSCSTRSPASTAAPPR